MRVFSPWLAIVFFFPLNAQNVAYLYRLRSMIAEWISTNLVPVQILHSVTSARWRTERVPSLDFVFGVIGLEYCLCRNYKLSNYRHMCAWTILRYELSFSCTVLLELAFQTDVESAVQGGESFIGSIILRDQWIPRPSSCSKIFFLEGVIKTVCGDDGGNGSGGGKEEMGVGVGWGRT